MEISEKSQLDTLFGDHRAPFVSIFVPTHQKGREIQQNPVRVRNLLKKAEEQLETLGYDSGRREEILAPAGPMTAGDHDIWRHPTEGLALFLSSDSFVFRRTPFPIEELVVVNDRRFHVKPLLPLLTDHSLYYVLAVSGNRVRLIRCSRFSWQELDLKDTSMPTNMGEALRFDDPENQLQFHSSMSTGQPQKGAHGVIFHGHSVSDETKDHLRRYFQDVDSGLRALLGNDHQPPLVLAGVDYLLPIYAEVSKYSGLVKEGITGNPDQLRADELREKAWPLVEGRFLEAPETLSMRYEEMRQSARASRDVREVVPAAYYGRVDSLFVELGAGVWGRFDSENEQVQVHDAPRPGDEDLLDVAAYFTLKNGGAVVVGPGGSASGGEPLTAIFRY